MSDMPNYILRNCNIFVDRVSQVGQASEITLPVPTEKLEEIRNAGMVMPIDVPMGYEKPEAGFKLTSFDPVVIKLFGLAVGVNKEFLATGALAHEDGRVFSATTYMVGRLTAFDPGSWSPGEKAETEYSISIRKYRLEVEGNVLVEADPFDVSVGGVSQTASIRRALLV